MRDFNFLDALGCTYINKFFVFFLANILFIVLNSPSLYFCLIISCMFVGKELIDLIAETFLFSRFALFRAAFTQALTFISSRFFSLFFNFVSSFFLNASCFFFFFFFFFFFYVYV